MHIVPPLALPHLPIGGPTGNVKISNCSADLRQTDQESDGDDQEQ
jgi:hypothetical protein